MWKYKLLRENIVQVCVASSLQVTWEGWWQVKPWEESFLLSSTSSSSPCRWLLGIVFVIYFSKDGDFVSRIPKTIWQRFIIPGEPGRHRLLVLPDSIHLRCSFSGEKPAHFTFYNISTCCQVAYCAVQTTQFFTFYAGTAGGPQLRLAQQSHLRTLLSYHSQSCAKERYIEGTNIWAFSV